ncbi:hypothetical protein Sta7437_4414 [Stanieria cyanosphaera PCC 7437]|uniref:Uncharacterized protein n=1 Tax=Stanieria cyanosphaera (strain ATCC 29371 / PCC 7437) TaxID=111780 RepID=K9Y1L6_STAC7|nr:hypothetical protein [Stanieria cyanosphaera]AFZ37882.1 hypothetical protein Sta7437_4414 [Stanieria cyanosphaera PCC 7437]
MESPLDCTSANFEKVAISRFRSLVKELPETMKVFREPWGCSTVICLDCENCPQWCSYLQENSSFLVQAVIKLGLANSIIFRMGKKTLGWIRIDRD